MATVIRRASKHDAATLSALNADVQGVHAAAMPWLFKPPGPDTFPLAAAADILTGPENFVFIAEVDGMPAGYAYAEIIHRPETSFHYAHDLLYLHHITVRPDHRRRGLGGALIDAVQEAAERRCNGFVALDVWTFNEGARAFFRRSGFAPFSERLWNRAISSAPIRPDREPPA